MLLQDGAAIETESNQGFFLFLFPAVLGFELRALHSLR
jgi:hypothetical protein